MNEFKVANAEVTIREDIGVDELIDSLMRNRLYVPYIKVLNKIDKLQEDSVKALEKDGWLAISAGKNLGLELLKRVIWEKLNLMRIYMKRIGREADMKQPLIIQKPADIRDVANKIHREAFGRKLEYARIWGKSAKFPGQKVGVDKLLQDEDIVELHID
jgi:ribosome-interacting GTPase 1